MNTTNRIERKIERSSIGTPAAKAVRRTVSTATAARVVARAQEHDHNTQVRRERRK